MTTQEFVEKYNIGMSFDEMYTHQRQLKIVKGFTSRGGERTSERKSFIEGLEYMLMRYLENQISPAGIGEPNTLDEFNLAQFVADYEDAKKDEFEKSGSTRERKPFEGAKDRAIDAVLEKAQAYNKSVVDIWAQSIKDGVDLDILRSATSGNDHKSREAAVIAHKAMEKVINERTWKWRIFNLRRLIKENIYMSQLKAAVRDMDENRDIILNQYSEPVISSKNLEALENFRQNVKGNVNKEVKAEVKAEIKPLENKESLEDEIELVEFKEKKRAPIPKPTNKTEVKKLFDNKKVTEHITKRFDKLLSNENVTKKDKKATATAIHTMLRLKVTDTWSTPEKMQTYAMNFFKDIYNKIDRGLPQLGVEQKLVAAQKMTNTFFKTYSPVASDPSLAEFGDNYGMKNMDEEDIQKLTGYEENAKELMDNVKQSLGIANAKERISFSNGEFDEGKVEKAEKIEKIEALQTEIVKE